MLALFVLVLCAALLGYIHRDDLRSALGYDTALHGDDVTGDPAASCIQQRFGEIQGMMDEGVIGSEQATAFKQRAEAMCRSTEGHASGPPLPIE